MSLGKTDLDNAVFEQLRELFGDDLRDIIQTYLADTPVQIAAMAKAVQDRDYAVLGRAAHSLKSSSSALGAVGVAETAAAVEDQVRTQASFETIEAGIAGVRAAFASVEPHLDAAAGTP